MVYKENDFVAVEYDMYANGVLVQTTDEKKGIGAKFEKSVFKPVNLVLGKGLILKAFDDAIIKSKSESGVLELTTENAFGRRVRELVRVMPKSAFDEQKLRAVVGMTYDFNGMFGTVKAVSAGRITVDFNNPLSGKEIKIEYKILKKLEDVAEKVAVVMEDMLRISPKMFEVTSKDKIVSLKVPKQLIVMKEYLNKSFEELIPEIKDYTLNVEVLADRAKV